MILPFFATRKPPLKTLFSNIESYQFSQAVANSFFSTIDNGAGAGNSIRLLSESSLLLAPFRLYSWQPVPSWVNRRAKQMDATTAGLHIL
jgi:hypothetical protein